MIIWSGLGFLVAIIGFGSLVLTELLSESLTKNDQFYQENDWVKMTGMILAALLTLGLHKLLNLQKAKRVIDVQTGEEIVLRKSHTFFFIPVKWWPLTFLILGALFMVIGPSS